jgi:hypothetical protein
MKYRTKQPGYNMQKNYERDFDDKTLKQKIEEEQYRNQILKGKIKMQMTRIKIAQEKGMDKE